MAAISCSFDLSAMVRAVDGIELAVQSGARDADLGRGMMTALSANDEYQQRIYWRNSQHGGPWPDLARSTKMRRRRLALGLGAPRLAPNADPAADMDFFILVITGQKYRSLQAGNDGHWFYVSDDSMQSGTEIEDAHFHQTGGPRLPRRQVISQPDDPTLARMRQAIAVGVAAMWSGVLGPGIVPIWNW